MCSMLLWVSRGCLHLNAVIPGHRSLPEGGQLPACWWYPIQKNCITFWPCRCVCPMQRASSTSLLSLRAWWQAYRSTPTQTQPTPASPLYGYFQSASLAALAEPWLDSETQGPSVDQPSASVSKQQVRPVPGAPLKSSQMDSSCVKGCFAQPNTQVLCILTSRVYRLYCGSVKCAAGVT